MPKAFTATLSGRVQGVMFRDFIQRKATAFSVVGEVENMQDGNVRVYAEGDAMSLEKLIEHLKQGPILANIENISIEWIVPRGGYKDFSIHY